MAKYILYAIAKALVEARKPEAPERCAGAAAAAGGDMGMRNTNDIIRDLDRCARPEETCVGCTYDTWHGPVPCTMRLLADAHQAALSQDARWESMRAMHRQGGNDVQIAGEMGCSVSAVRRWRVRQGLPPNSRDGWNKRRERRTDNG